MTETTDQPEATKQLLTRDAVYTDLPSMTKEEAIRFVGDALVERGHVDASYVDAMLLREETVSTFLGNGVAMPHGTLESKEAVMSTGIVVAQSRTGIDWGVGTAHLVIGLGAVGDDHIHILSHIADVLQDDELAEELWTADGDVLHEALNLPAPGSDEEDEADKPASNTITICEGAGLHARPASLIVDLAKNFDGSIKITKDAKTVRADSIMGVLSLGAVAGDTISVDLDGADSEAAFAEITRILTTPEAEL